METVPFLFDYWWLVALLWLAIFTFISIIRKPKTPRNAEVDTNIMDLQRHVEERESRLQDLGGLQLKRQAERRSLDRTNERRKTRE